MAAHNTVQYSAHSICIYRMYIMSLFCCFDIHLYVQPYANNYVFKYIDWLKVVLRFCICSLRMSLIDTVCLFGQ